MKIELFSTGCANCQKCEANVKTAIKESGLKVDYEKIEDVRKIVASGIQKTPALYINGREIASGRVPEVAEIKNYLK